MPKPIDPSWLRPITPKRATATRVFETAPPCRAFTFDKDSQRPGRLSGSTRIRSEVRARGAVFARSREAAGSQATSLRQALRNLAERPGEPSRRVAEAAVVAGSKGCTGCHARRRNN
jgi:hypothetical protein